MSANKQEPPQESTSTPEQDRALEEGSKLFHDTFKHLTTLSTGSVVLIATFFERFKSLHWKSLASLALVGFIVSTVGSVLLMLFLAKDVAIMGKPTQRDWLFRYGSWITGVCFVLSVLLLAVFAAGNLS
jgi:Mn2+/Fe2+ NRAMP family transporter